jgi:gentisate 1,2-dioxygenase
VLWRYRDLREHVLRSVSLVTPEQAGRRVIYLDNPGRRDVSAAVGWLYSGLQVMNPGECASTHRHSASALRFIMEGRGAYTIVDGHKMTLGANDFVLTPNGTWHEHGVDADGTACIWQDGLDIPLVNALEANFYEVHPDLHQKVEHPVDDSTSTWAATALLPSGTPWSKPYSPLFKYEWGPTYEALSRYAKTTDGSPFDGVLMNYVNPLTGGPVMPTINASMQLLRPGEQTRAHRHTGSFLYQVAKGRGFSVVGGQRLDWEERDIFCVPSWTLHEHGNASRTEDACLFCFSDLPVMKALGLYREQA